EDIKSEDGTFEITTEPADFEAVEKALADNNVAVMMSEISMIPDTMAELSLDDAAKVQRLIDALEDLDDVQDVFTNADLPDEE
ncbi:MAG: YebC/PmpR family DNA-binding transcriptional regulator, partial [Acidaminococcaceae bacterium]